MILWIVDAETWVQSFILDNLIWKEWVYVKKNPLKKCFLINFYKKNWDNITLERVKLHMWKKII